MPSIQFENPKNPDYALSDSPRRIEPKNTFRKPQNKNSANCGIFYLRKSEMVNYVKSKLNAICTELLEVYSYMREITVTDNILLQSRTIAYSS